MARKIKVGTMDQLINDRYAEYLRNVEADQRLALQVGDRVKYRSEVGTVDDIKLYEGANMYHVRFDRGGRWAYRATELKRVKVN